MRKIAILIALFAIGALFMAGCSNPTGGRSGDKVSVKADAGIDKIVNLFTADNKMKEITLDGSLSKGAVAYKWAQTEDSKHAVILDSEAVLAKFLPRSEGIYKFILQITDKNGEKDSDEVTFEVQLNPDIYLRSPVTNEAVISSNERLLDISGMCDKGIVSVSATNHTNNKIFDGKFDNDYYFTVAGIELWEGDNDIEIIGLDKSGEFSKRKLLVTYNKDIKFLSPPVFSKNSGYDNKTSVITISVPIDYNIGKETIKVNLFEIDDNLQVVNGRVAMLYDNGNSSNGDEKEFDGVFSGKAMFINPSKGIHKYRVAVNKAGKVYYSSPVEFTSLADTLGTEEYDLATEAVNKASDNYHRSISNKLTEEDILEKRQLVVQELLMSPYIKSAVLSSDNATIWITFNSGMETFIKFKFF